jgi:glutathione synthase/RimK-type ligase-like ATP-grasp enzyme
MRHALITADGHSVSHTDDLVVFCREFDLPSVSSIDSVNECVALEETRGVLNGWASSVPRARWVDHPVVQAEFDNKPIQLHIAQHYGFVIPDTLITNEPEAVRSFGLRRRVVIKQLSNLSYIGINQSCECIYTTPVEEPHWEYVDEIRTCPVMLQQRIEKVADVRITVVGSEAFPAKITSNSHNPNVVDFRARTEERIESIEIPDHLRHAVIEMTKHMGLRYAAFDFGLTEENHYVFFEANVGGNWLWIEKDTGMPISRRLADLLLQIN